MTPRIVFAGTPEFAATILSQLIAADRPPVAVYTQPDRRRRRGKTARPSPVKALAVDNGIEVFQPANFRDAADVDALRALRPDLLVVAAYGLILPSSVLTIAGEDGRGSVNVHASLLPRWRGAAPVERAIMAGDTETGVCLMQMERGLDTGPVFARAATPIEPNASAGELESRLATIGGELLIAHLPALLDRSLQPEPQSESGVVYAHKITSEDSIADLSNTAALVRQIAAMRDRSPVTFYAGTEPVRILKASAVIRAAASGDPAGSLRIPSRKRLELCCQDGAIAIEELRLTRGKGTPMNAAAALNGFSDLFHDGARLTAEPD